MSPSGSTQLMGFITWQDYERQVRGLYAGYPAAPRQYTAVVDGVTHNGIADHAVSIGGRSVAVEAKHFNSPWERSIRNPRGTLREKLFAIAEQRKLIAQARKYSAAFDEVVYHSNSLEFIRRYK